MLDPPELVGTSLYPCGSQVADCGCVYGTGNAQFGRLKTKANTRYITRVTSNGITTHF